MTLILIEGSTRTLDVAIAQERVRYASERVDFHTFFSEVTVADIQKSLRGDPPTTPITWRGDKRRDTIFQLFDAQRESPHPLWELLLVQAFEATLVRRRRALSADADSALDELVLETFRSALQNLPYSVDDEELQAHIMTVSRTALTKRAGRKRIKPRVTVPPVSGVVGSDECSADEPAASPTEVA